ncbi:MAG: SPFH domain-containing protein [candidate division KSB1 bacterium]|nr:SPFH domain-containing protein [candidate division KSB1 bacterium]
MFGFRIIPQGYAIVVERLGKFNRVSYSGVRFVIPVIEKTRPIFFTALAVDVRGARPVVTKLSELVDLREQVLDFPRQSVIKKKTARPGAQRSLSSARKTSTFLLTLSRALGKLHPQGQAERSPVGNGFATDRDIQLETA